MAQLFEKCEQATQSTDPPTSASFDVDIEEFVHRQEREGKPFFSDDPEADNLVRIMRADKIKMHYFKVYWYALTVTQNLNQNDHIS